MKTALCAYCGKTIYWDEKRREWRHETPTRDNAGLMCVKVSFATPRKTPRKGSIEK
jgi:hypothetical protein